jgi:predicted amidophosphoribosyltransferase
MNKAKCPHCGVKLGNYTYADACPHCHKELVHNTRPLVSAPQPESAKPESWCVRTFFRIVRCVES